MAAINRKSKHIFGMKRCLSKSRCPSPQISTKLSSQNASAQSRAIGARSPVSPSRRQLIHMMNPKTGKIARSAQPRGKNRCLITDHRFKRVSWRFTLS